MASVLTLLKRNAECNQIGTPSSCRCPVGFRGCHDRDDVSVSAASFGLFCCM